MTPDTITINSTKIPKIGIGTYKLTGEEGMRSISDALALGYRHIDTAQMYGNEAEVGRAILDSGVPREEIFLTTKVWPSDFTGLLPAVEASLRKLQTDHVDLLLLHWPADEESNKTGASLLYEALRKGYTKSVGVSNFNLTQLEQARQLAPLICNQVEYHPYLSQAKLLAYLHEYKMFLTAYRPLAVGRVVKDETLIAIGSRYQKSAGQVALRWLVQQDDVAVIPKASSRERRMENLDIFDFELSEEDMKTIYGLNRRERLTDPATAPNWEE